MSAHDVQWLGGGHHMNGFEYIFTLFGLLLGLALAEGLGGLARVLKARHHVHVGWPTALLGLFVSCDLVTFWLYGWELREIIPVTWPAIFGGFVVTAIYYLAASLIFPDGDLEDLDAHFDRHYRTVMAGVFVCNVALFGTLVTLMDIPDLFTLRFVVVGWSAFPILLLAICTRDRRVVMGCLVYLISLYPLAVVWA